MRRCIQCKHHVLGTPESHLCSKTYQQDNSVYEGQCPNEEGHSCKDWGDRCSNFDPLPEEALVNDTHKTIADCEAMLQELGGGTAEEEALPDAPPSSEATPEGTILAQGDYLQGANNPSYVYCFCPMSVKAGHKYLYNIITGGHWDCSGSIIQCPKGWLLKSSSALKVITPQQALDLLRAAHKLD